MENMNSTSTLLSLVGRSTAISDPDQLRTMLQAGHAAWCEGVAEVRADVAQRSSALDDDALAAWCTQAEAPWEGGQTRCEAVSNLAFAVWDASPAAMAYVALEERAAEFGICLIPE
ncbi:hypothetical protein SLUN_00135 [Streptomyces lunaelactis]|uniref:Uncharacterized protein n=1 Tax=Streptomyces lunaelactis TaxID=1535768 RepID=A0A2R4SVP4_9ACTN|nr:hypothetical protein [Streptomyces lunaelactis]AVZ70912.1 hypothetical protein SLUN_00135 [Streptomyces lunaelactis]NUK25168.1 hypothetical protein [Streptomyces lunaelactis]NUK85621.1 hypothetical protein [Streptomyces lunaelactis]